MSATPKPAAPHPAMRLGRVLLGLALATLLTLAATVAGLWTWSAREGSLATALAWLQARGPLQLQASEVSGSLRQGGRIGQLEWQQADQGLRLQAQALEWRWDLGALLRSAWSGPPELHLRQLQARQLRIEPATSAQPAPAPTALPLPLRVSVDDVQVDELVWAGPTAWQLQDLAGRYRYDGQTHQAELRQVRHAQGRYHGRLQLEAGAPLGLQAELDGELLSPLPGSRRPVALTLQARGEGTLLDFALQARLDSPQAGARSQAELQARVQPWQDPPLPQASARLQDINLAALWPQAPATRLSGQAQLAPQGQGWQFSADLSNTSPGPWDQARLPLQSLQAQGRWQDGAWRIEALQARLGAAQLQAQGQWNPLGRAPHWQAQARFEGLDPSQIDSRWPAQVLQGQAQAEQAGGAFAALRFELALQGSRTGAWLSQAQARGQWLGGQLQVEQAQLRSRDASLALSGRWQAASRRGQGQLQLQAPGLSASLQAHWPPAQGAGGLELQASDVARALGWLRGLPVLPASLEAGLAGVRARGQAELRLDWPAGLADAQIQGRLDLPELEGLPGGLKGRDVRANVQGRLTQAAWQLQARTEGAPAVQAQARGELVLPPASLPRALSDGVSQLAWMLRLQQVELALEDPGLGRWRLSNPQALNLRGTGAQLQAEPGQLTLQPPPRAGPQSALLAWQVLRWQDGQFHSTGSLSGLPQSWVELLAGPWLQRAGMQGDLVFDGRWDLRLGRQLSVQAELLRRSGDLSLHAETGQGLAARVSAGLREARLNLQAQGQDLLLGWRWDSERAGQSQGQLRSRLQQDGDRWRWPEDAPLSGQLQAQLPRLGVWSALSPPGWRLRGSLTTQLSVSGSRSRPQFSGPLQAEDLALRSVVDGIELGRGRLRAQFEGERLRLDEFSLQGAGAQGGSLRASGQASWRDGRPQLQLQARLERLRASVRRDLALTVSGDLQARMDDLPQRRPVQVSGTLRLDQARIRLPDEGRPELASDVVLRGGKTAARSAPAAGPAAALLDLAVRLDLGDDFQIEGKGLNARLRGALAVTGDLLGGAPRLNGTLTTASGEYSAYGQRLEIERGLLRFTGAANNPALDILALRPRLTQRVGVQVTGTALLPRVRLYAEPELPEAEKLAWLVLGRSGAAGGAEAAVLQQAALALLGDRSSLNRGGLAASLGLDELSFNASGSPAEGGATAGAITLGKRLSSNFYAAYQSSLSGALGTLFLFYDLSQRLTVRAQTGAQTAIDLIYTLPYD